jgi:hypothetical protein
MRFEPVDRSPLMEMGVWDETMGRWHDEGLPKWVTCLQHLEDYLGLDRSWNCNWLPIARGIYPPFEVEVLEETESEQVIGDEEGVILRQRRHHRTIPQFIRFPVENESDYEGLLPRPDGMDPERYPDDFDEDLRFRLERGEIIGFSSPAFFGFPRGLIGLEDWRTAFCDQSGLVRRIMADRLDSPMISTRGCWQRAR